MNFILRKGESQANDKPKLFLYISPKDCPWQNKLLDLFLSALNCVLFFPEENSAVIDKQELEQIDLFAILVTDNLLRDSSVVFDELCSIAKQCKTPLFFIRISDVDFADFEAKYGCLHIFDATHIKDGKEKRDLLTDRLRNKLFEVLGSDADIDQIYENFVAQFFLSYRKKDYHFVEQLLELVHNYPLLRDVAIWYDDFLIPGVNYNDSIENALRKSTVLFLLVTDSLLENGNYVIRVEYPLAQQENKTIVPLQFSYTDREELLKKFPFLPPCIDIEDVCRVKSVLEQISIQHSIHAQNNAPKHLYFMGLAYLLGIGVKKSETSALSLLAESAHKGYADSWFKLGTIYAYGNRVEKDYVKAINFLEKYVFEKIRETINFPTDLIEEKKLLTSEEYDRYASCKKTIVAIRLLLSLYKLAGYSEVKNINGLISFCKSIIVYTYGFAFHVNTFQMITGYEITRDHNGKEQIGRAIYSDFKVVTTVFPDEDVVEILDLLVSVFCSKMSGRTKMEILEYSISVYERLCDRAGVESRFVSGLSLQPIIRKLVSTCFLARDTALADGNIDEAKLFNNKGLFNKKRLNDIAYD